MIPKVSIVVPMYGVEPFLNKCVDSLLAQSLHDIEIILVDDGSPDKCGQIIDEYKEKDKNKKYILFILIILLTVLLGMFIGYLLSKHYNKINDNTIHQGDLLGIYQNENFTNYIENIKDI